MDDQNTGSTRPLVLAVDDAAENLFMLKAIVRSAGLDFAAASSGAASLAAIDARPPAVVLLDIEMPVMDGFETCRRIREIPTTADLPVIFLTAACTDAVAAQAREAGGTDAIGKPFDPIKLCEQLRRWAGAA